MKNIITEMSAKLVRAISDEVNNEESENYIDLNQVDLTEFIHALANVAPNFIYQTLTGDDKNSLEFNHLANDLCFQYINKVD